ncbi:MAG: 30S ribosomal protein S12 methylthiotransferase RimO [Clostridiales bacterium]|jgi:ribosomal protein S12 methylthiotransferase|nr:30S ribosomal protein S12 methylthiotransferase RimO [Clostridiales bacterium]
MSKKLAVLSLGCDKNRVDTENMLYYLSGNGYEVTDDYGDAEVAVVNTCAFIASAREEAIDAILSLAAYKKTGRLQKLVVTGCLPQRYRAELIQGLPEVDAFLGTDEYERITAVLGGDAPAAKNPAGRVLTTLPHYAYLKIAEGCDNHCTFCAIPSIRGRYRSRGLKSLLAEADGLVKKGVKELILVAQDVTRYGEDLTGGAMLPTLIDGLSQSDVSWIRLMYCYPERIGDALIERLADNAKLCKYIDIPMQHADDAVLKRMNRKSTNASLSALIGRLRSAVADIELRTTFMVGFPGETEAAFETLCRFVADHELSNAGIFCFSPEAGTPAAKLPDRIGRAVQEERLERLGALIYQNVQNKNKRMVGKTVTVLYEDIDYERKLFKGRTQHNAPEVDRLVYFSGRFADAGTFYPVRITGTDGYDLVGKLVEPPGVNK